MEFKIGIIGIGYIAINTLFVLKLLKSSLKKAYDDGVITKYTLEIDESFEDCDIIFICTPVSYILEYARKLAKIVKSDCIITDIGSTKSTIIQGVKELNIEFIGGHPMVGSERSGYDTSKDFLFENSYYIITKTNQNKESTVENLKEIILEIKAIPIIIDAKEHDYIVSVISHVPHVVAATLVNMVKNLDNEKQIMKMLAAGGFKDITRIASSNPTMWSNICTENKEEIVNNLKVLVQMINEFIANMEDSKKVYRYFELSKNYRDSFTQMKVNGNTIPELDISIKDENGAIAKVTTILSNNNIGIKNIEVLNNRENNYGVLKIIVRTYEEREKAYKILTNMGYDVNEII